MVIKFDLVDDSDVSGLSQGYVTIIGPDGVFCSDKRSSMIFISISLFLKGIVTLMTTSTKGCEFPAIDSSFSFAISKLNKKSVRLMYGNKVIEQISNEALVISVWNAVDDILSRYPQILEAGDGDAVAVDLRNAVNEFKATFPK
jgi:hypothetical protein